MDQPTDQSAAPSPKPKRRMISLIITVVLVVLLLLLVVPPLLIIDDWSRDLSTNHAAASEDATNEALRPIHSSHNVAEMTNRVKQAAGEISNWELAEEASNGDAVTLAFVRTTPLFRFRDDIIVTISPENDGSVVTAESQSRVGKGDLGQNPRNLKELLNKLRAVAKPTKS